MNEFYTLSDGTKIPKIGFGTYNEEFEDNRLLSLRLLIADTVFSIQLLCMKRKDPWEVLLKKAVYQDRKSLSRPSSG